MGIKFERVKDVFSICSDKIKVEFSEPQIQAHDDYGYCKNENGILYYYYDVDIYTKLNKKWKKMLEIDTYDFPNLINFKKILDLFISRDIDVNNYQKNFYNDEVICSTYNLETNGLGEDFYSVTCQYLENDGVKEKEYYNVTIGKSLFIDSSEVLGVTFNNSSYEELKTIYECVNGFIQYSIDNKNKIIIESNKKEINAWKIQGSKLYKLKEDNSIEEIYIKGDKIEDAIVLHGDIDSKDFYSSKICDFVIDDIKEDDVFVFFKLVEVLLHRGPHAGIFFFDCENLSAAVIQTLVAFINLYYLSNRMIFLYNISSGKAANLKDLSREVVVLPNQKIPHKN